MAKKKLPGHYCKICGERKANEAFNGKGHADHVCKQCSSSPQEPMNEFQIIDDVIFDNADIDSLPAFSEKKKFAGLDKYEKMLLRDYIYSEISEYLAYSDKVLGETELIEIRKRMIVYLEKEQHILLKNDATLRQFFQDNVTSILNKLQQKAADSR